MEYILTTKGTMPKTITGASIPEYIEIKMATGDTVAFLSPESDGLKECWIDDEQNGTCTIEFELPLNSEKWQYLTDQYRIYADGKEFVILNPDAVDKQRDGQKLTGKIKAHESWVLLGKKYQTISNDPQNPNPPWGAVIIVSGGEAHGGFEAGSAGSALSYLLNGTGWTVGTVDVVGTFDLETEKESVLYNINQVQEKWGGILIWDSINKTVSLRDEEAWQNYTGYQIRYAKNLKGINRVDDYDIVTRLYPFGENDLNIATVNGGLLYLDNQSYSTQVLEGVWYNQDIADQNQLKTQGEKQLAVMCRPRHNYKTEVLDLRSLPGYGHETFKRSDMVDLFDEDFGANARVRIIRYRHNVFQPWLCDMELGDPIEKISATVAQTVLMAKFYKNVVAPNTSFQNLLKAIINTEATEINGASGDYTLVDGVSTWFDRDEVTGELTGKLLRITPQGLIISYDGGQTWKLAISGEGIHADAGWVGKLNAGVITVGADTTFESGYDPTQITSVGMGVDADCLGLWHFDGSLNNHKGIPAIADANFDTGCFGQAVKVEEGTTNLVTNGNFADGTTGWVSLTSDTDITQTIVTESGKTFNHVVCNITDENVYPGIKQTGIAVSPNATYTISGLGYSPYEDGVLAVFGKVSGGIALAGFPTSQGIASFTFTTGADDTSVDVWVAFSAGAVTDDYFKVTEIQLEQKDHATSYVDGTRTGEFKMPTTGMSASEGTINFLAKNLAESANGAVLVDLPKSDNAQGIRAGISADTGHEGEVYIAEATPTFTYSETTQADFNTGTLVDVVTTSAGDLQIASGKTIGTREKVVDISEVGETNVGSSLSFSKTDAVVTDAVFTRDSVAYKEDGTQVAANAPRYEQGGVLIEEGTINLVSNPDFEVDTGGWNTWGGIIARDTTEHYYGLASLRVELPSGGNAWDGTYSNPITVTAEVTYTFSVKLKNQVAGVPMIAGIFRADNNAQIGTTTFTSTTGWIAKTVTATIPVGVTSVYVRVSRNNYSSATTFWVDGFQLEQKPYATSFISGTRANEELKIPSSSVFMSDDWTIAFRCKLVLTPYVNLWGAILEPREQSSYNHWYLDYLNTDLNFRIRNRTAGTEEVLIVSTAETDWQNGNYHFYCLRYDYTNKKFYLTVDGVTKVLEWADMPTFDYSIQQWLRLGHNVGGSFQSGFIFDELAIFDYAATDTEVSNWHSSGIPFKQGCVYKMDFTNNLQATVGSVKVETALSTDGGATYGALQEAVSGQAIPGITNSTDLFNARLKIKETLYTSSVTPKLHDLSLGITKRLPTTVYGPNKSTLTGWDSISLAWKSDRLSLVVNDSEACFIENPGLPTAFGSYLYIGTDRNGANAINTLIDELRIDKVYRDADIRTGWHKTGVPFYTSEDMKQWPGYLRAETDGLKVYDSEDTLRVLVGSWLRDAVRKYGIKIVDGEVYSSLFRTGSEDALAYIELTAPNILTVYGRYNGTNSVKVLEIIAPDVEYETEGGGTIYFYRYKTTGSGLAGMIGYVNGDIIISSVYGYVKTTDLHVWGNITKTGSYSAVEPTEDYGTRLLYATETPELLYYDRGVTNLINGEAIVKLDPIFLQCIEPDAELTPWQVWVESYGENGVYVAEVGEDYFKVKERNGGGSDNKVIWRLEATRKNYTGIRLMEVVN